ncbi:DUF5050 domain-containing protein, partial [Pedobacter sp. SYSU D00535]|uniref:DUF5050 domain-containing protein n=1 Tax=Pedobacter sp. SYSU D00535 TaxID=2810308 RepID=UPI001A979A94
MLSCIAVNAQVAATKVYWIQQSSTAVSDQLVRANLDGSSPEVLASDAGNFAQPFRIAVDKLNGFVYVADATSTGSAGIVRFDLNGGSRTVVALPLSTGTQYSGVTTYGNKLYFIVQSSTAANDQLVRANLDGSNPEVLASGATNFFQPMAIATNGTYIFVADGTGTGSKGIVRFNMDGSAATSIVTPITVAGSQYIGVAVSGGKLYYLTQGTSASNDQVVRANLDGSSPVILASGATNFLQPQAFAVDETTGYIYVADGTGTGSKGVVRLNIDGSNPVTVGAAYTAAGTQYTGVAMNNATSVPLTATISSSTNVSCNGGSNGSAAVTASGGTTPYTYSWSPAGGTAATTTGRAAGTYTVTVTDAASATATATVAITQPSAFSISTAQSNVSCFGGSNGAAAVSVSGGTAPYTYSWAPSGGTFATATGRPAGTYTVTITDNNGCTATRTFNITQPSAPLAGSTVITNVSTAGGSDGSVDLTPSGGTPPYTYNWGGGITTQDRTGLAAGNYTVVITDNNGCQATLTAAVTQPVAVSGTTVVTNVACFGGSTGVIDLTPSGGTGPYIYDWGNGITTEDRTGLAAGTYTVVIADNLGATGTVTATVTQPTAPVSGTTVVSNVGCFGGNTGAINLTPSGGTGPYTYTWLPSGPTTEDRTGLVAGTYTVMITDANSCTGTVTVA